MLAITKRTPRRMLWAPMSSIAGFHEEIERLFEDFFAPTLSGEITKEGAWSPAIDVYEDENQFTLKAELPGMKEKDIHIAVEDNTLSIKGERKEERAVKEGHYHKLERCFGSFYRAFELPGNLQADKISARYRDGVLEVDLPKATKGKPKHIDVKVT